MDAAPRSFAQLLRHYRRAAGLTQEALAERAGVSWRAVSDLERGVSRSPRRETLLLLADALALPAEERAAFEAVARMATRLPADADGVEMQEEATELGTAARAAMSPTPAHEEALPEAQPSGPLPRGGYLGAQPEHRMVAREAERGRVAAAIDAVIAGAGRLLLLSGEPGVGKTRLAQEATALARARGFRILVGRCYEQDASLPFAPLVEIFTTAAGIASPALRRALPQRFPELGRLLPRLLPLPVLPEGDEGRRRLLAAAGEFLQALAAEGPLIVGLDDLQWADSASLDLLVHLARALRAHRVLLLGTYRDVDVDRTHPLQATISSLTRERLLEGITLRGLPPDGTAALIRAQFSVAAVSDTLVRLVHERTEGNPFFIEEVLQALVEREAIHQADDGWEHTELAAIELPQSIRAVVGQRVERLGTEALEVLRVASVLGQEFELDLLLSTAGREQESVLAQLDAAVAAHVLEERRVGRQERYAFAHALIAQVLYDEVPRHRLRRLHLRVGEALERARGGRPEAAAELARHFLAAGDEGRASRYAILAGKHAASQYANAEAVRHYEVALELLLEAEAGSGSDPVAAVRRHLGHALLALNRTAEAVAAFEAARDSYHGAGDLATLAEVEREIGWTYQASADFVSAAPHLEAALRLWPAGREDAGLARLLLETARARILSGDSAAAEALAERGCVLADRLGLPELQAQGLVERSLQAAYRSDLRHALALADEAEPLARRCGARQTLFRVCHNRGEIRRRLGELRQALADAQEATALAPESGLLALLPVARWNEADYCLLLGRWEQGRAAARAALAIDPADPVGVAPMLAWMGGDAARALALARQALADARRRRDGESITAILTWLVGWHLQLGEPAVVLALEPDARHLGGAGGMLPWLESHLAEAAVLAGVPSAGALVAAAAALMERTQFFLVRPQVLRAQGLLLYQGGNPQRALTVLRESAAQARGQDALPQLASSLASLATVARAAGDDVQAVAADAERASVVECIGPAARGLPWSVP